MPQVVQPGQTNFTSPEATKFTPEIKNKKPTKKQMMGMAGAALALFSAIGVGVNAMNQQNRQSTTTEAPAEPGQVPQKSVESTSIATTTTPEINTDKYLSAMEKYKEIDVDTFESLPRDERLLYSRYIIDQTVSRGTYSDWYGENARYKDYAVELTAISNDNSGQEILNYFLHSEQISYLQFIEGEYSKSPFDPSDAQKVLSSIYYDVGNGKHLDSTYSFTKNQMKTVEFPDHMIEKLTGTNTSKLLSGRDDAGEVVQYKDVTFYNQDTKTFYARFAYCEFTNYDGTRQAIWLMDNHADTPEELAKICSVK